MPSTRYLLDLYPDVLFLLFREFLSVEDKLDTLMDMPEFRAFLEDRRAWRTASPHFSIPFIRWMRTLKPGWYLSYGHRCSRFFLTVDYYRLSFTLYFYLLDQGLDALASPTRSERRMIFPGLKRVWTAFLKNYDYGPSLNAPMYHLQGHTLVRALPFSPNPRLLYFYDWDNAAYDLPFFEPRRMHDERGRPHYKVTLTYHRTLVVECLLRRGECLCEKPIISLLPYWPAEDPGDLLTLINGATVPLAGSQTFQFVGDNHIKGTTTYYIPHLKCLPVEVQNAK